MGSEGNRPRASHDPELNPYAAPRAPIGPGGGRSRPFSAGQKAIPVTHDLTDDELKRFVNCDTFYDPMPLLGFIPQWVWVLPLTAATGFFLGLTRTRSFVVALVAAPAFSAIVLAIMVMTHQGRRKTARLLGLCDNRTLTVAPDGLTLTILVTGAIPKELASVAPQTHAWEEFREIESTREFITFWLKGRSRIILPRRAFPGPAEADAFLDAANSWHGDAT